VLSLVIAGQYWPRWRSRFDGGPDFLNSIATPVETSQFCLRQYVRAGMRHQDSCPQESRYRTPSDQARQKAERGLMPRMAVIESKRPAEDRPRDRC